MSQGPAGGNPDRGLLGALAGTEAERTCDTANRTRRVVAASLGVMRQEQAVRRRSRSVALAVTLLIPVLLGPIVWWGVEQLTESGHLSSAQSQLALWVCLLCPALGAAALVAGWMRR